MRRSWNVSYTAISANDISMNQSNISQHTDPNIRLQQAISLHQSGKIMSAIEIYRQLLELSPKHAFLLFLLGTAEGQRGNTFECLNLFDQSLAISPNNPDIYYNKGKALYNLKRLDEALQSFDRAIRLKPDCIDAYYNRGLILNDFKRFDEALQSFDCAIQLRPDYKEAHDNRGISLNYLKRSNEALQSHNRAIQLNPNYAEAYYNRGIALVELKQLDAALESYDKAMAIKPDLDFLYGNQLYVKTHICDWKDIEVKSLDLFERIERNEKVASPFTILALTDSLSLQRKVAEIWIDHKCPINHSLGTIQRRAKSGKIRIGYYSADFHNHATAYLMAELFERHDKTRFELIAFSYGPDKKDEMRQRISTAFGTFIDVRDKSDEAVALLSRTMGVDIAVDLKGFTADGRIGIFSYRAAPIQVSYMGYPGTTGSAYFDYIIADRTLIPEESQYYYSEKIVYLPNSYQVNDTKRTIADKLFTRQELGLPETGFIFCCFNNNYKITPSTFDGWMRMLNRVEDSVLWLLEDNLLAAHNLRIEAEKRGVNSLRLVFAKRLPLMEHLARHRAADLFIDTLPCNAHTTTSDALWAGLPVLTCVGEAFASRVAASLLNAIDLPELITYTQVDFEAMAIELATNQPKLQAIKDKLEKNRLTTSLFDTLLYTKHIEDAYTQMYERHQSEMPPDYIYV